MRIAALAIAALCLTAGPLAAQQKQTETIDRTIAFSRGGTLKLKNFSGDVRITGTAGNDIIVHAVRTATRERLEHVTLDIAINGSTVSIEANRQTPGWENEKDNVVETRFDIQVPAATVLDLDVFSSDLVVRDTTSEIQAKTFSGSIDIDVSKANGLPDLTAETFSGDISTKVPPGGSGRVRFNSFSGELHSDAPVMVQRGSRKNITADLGSGGGAQLEFKTFSGDVRLVK